MTQHWMRKPKTIRMLWILFAVVLLLTVLVEPFVDQEPHFAVEALFGFNAWYGFIACAALILLAKLLGATLKRPDTYYERGDD